jgi:hypothetical protein
LYFSKAFKDYTPHVIGAMRLVANSYEPEELNRFGMGMYVSASVSYVQIWRLTARMSSNLM